MPVTSLWGPQQYRQYCCICGHWQKVWNGLGDISVGQGSLSSWASIILIDNGEDWHPRPFIYTFEFAIVIVVFRLLWEPVFTQTLTGSLDWCFLRVHIWTQEVLASRCTILVPASSEGQNTSTGWQETRKEKTHSPGWDKVLMFSFQSWNARFGKFYCFYLLIFQILSLHFQLTNFVLTISLALYFLSFLNYVSDVLVLWLYFKALLEVTNVFTRASYFRKCTRLWSLFISY